VGCHPSNNKRERERERDKRDIYPFGQLVSYLPL
jgi:hypothetical protein